MSPKKSKMDKVFPWQREALRQLRACVGSRDSKPLQTAMMSLLREVTPCVDDIISEKKFQRGKRFLSALRPLVVHFELRRPDVDKDCSSPSLPDISSSLLSIMLDLRIFLTRSCKKPLSREKALSQIIGDSLLFTDPNDRRMLWDMLLQSSALRLKKDKQLCAAILERLISESPWDCKHSPESYLKCLLCMRLWYQNVGKERKSEVMSRAHEIPVPKHLSRWLSASDLQGVPPFSKRAGLRAFVRPFLKAMGQETADNLCTTLSDEILEESAQSNFTPERTVGGSKEMCNVNAGSLFVIDRAGNQNPDDLSAEAILKQIEGDLANLPEMPVKSRKLKRKKRDLSSDSSDISSLLSSSVNENVQTDRGDALTVIAEEEICQEDKVKDIDVFSSIREISPVRRTGKKSLETKRKDDHPVDLMMSEVDEVVTNNIDDNSNNIDDNSNNIDDNSNNIDDNSNNIDDNSNNIDDNSNNIDDNSNNIDDNSNNIDDNSLSKTAVKAVKTRNKLTRSHLDDNSSVKKKKKICRNSPKKNDDKNPTKTFSPESNAIAKTFEENAQWVSIESEDSDSTIENLSLRKCSKDVVQQFDRAEEDDDDDDFSVLTQKPPSQKRDTSDQLVFANVQYSSPPKRPSSSPKKCSSSFPKSSSAAEKISDDIKGMEDDMCCSELERSGILTTESRNSKESENPDTLLGKDVYVTDVVTQTDFSGDECSNIHNSEDINPSQLNSNAEQDAFLSGSQQLFSSQSSCLKLENINDDLSDEFFSPETTPNTTPEHSMTTSLFDRIKTEKGFTNMQDVSKSLSPSSNLVKKSPQNLTSSYTPKSTPLKDLHPIYSLQKSPRKGLSPLKHKSPNKASLVLRECQNNSPMKTSSMTERGASGLYFGSASEKDESPRKTEEGEMLRSPHLYLERDSSILGDVQQVSFLLPTISTPRSPRTSQRIAGNMNEIAVLNISVSDASSMHSKKEGLKEHQTVALGVNVSTFLDNSLTVSSPQKGDRELHDSEAKLLLTPPSTRCNSDSVSLDGEVMRLTKPVKTGKKLQEHESDNDLPSPVKRHLSIQKMKKCNSELEAYLESLQNCETGTSRKIEQKESHAAGKSGDVSVLSLTTENISLLDQADSRRKIRSVNRRKKVTCSVELTKLKSPDDARTRHVSLSSTETLPNHSAKDLVASQPSSSFNLQNSLVDSSENLSFFPRTYSRTKGKSLQKERHSSRSQNNKPLFYSSDSDGAPTYSQQINQNSKEELNSECESFVTLDRREALNVSGAKHVSPVAFLTPHTQSAVQEQTYQIIDDFLQECRSSLHKKAHLDDSVKSNSTHKGDLSSSQHCSVTESSQPKVTPTSDASVQTILQSRHIAMLTPNITRKRRSQAKRTSLSTSKLSSCVTRSPVVRTSPTPKRNSSRLASKSRTAVAKPTGSPRSKKMQKQPSSSISDTPEISERVTRSQSQSGYSFRTRSKTPGTVT